MANVRTLPNDAIIKDSIAFIDSGQPVIEVYKIVDDSEYMQGAYRGHITEYKTHSEFEMKEPSGALTSTELRTIIDFMDERRK